MPIDVDPFEQCDGEEESCSTDPFDITEADAFEQCSDEDECVVDSSNPLDVTADDEPFDPCEGEDVDPAGILYWTQPGVSYDPFDAFEYCDNYVNPDSEPVIGEVESDILDYIVTKIGNTKNFILACNVRSIGSYTLNLRIITTSGDVEFDNLKYVTYGLALPTGLAMLTDTTGVLVYKFGGTSYGYCFTISSSNEITLYNKFTFAESVMDIIKLTDNSFAILYNTSSTNLYTKRFNVSDSFVITNSNFILITNTLDANTTSFNNRRIGFHRFSYENDDYCVVIIMANQHSSSYLYCDDGNVINRVEKIVDLSDNPTTSVFEVCTNSCETDVKYHRSMFDRLNGFEHFNISCFYNSVDTVNDLYLSRWHTTSCNKVYITYDSTELFYDATSFMSKDTIDCTAVFTSIHYNEDDDVYEHPLKITAGIANLVSGQFLFQKETIIREDGEWNTTFYGYIFGFEDYDIVCFYVYNNETTGNTTLRCEKRNFFTLINVS